MSKADLERRLTTEERALLDLRSLLGERQAALQAQEAETAADLSGAGIADLEEAAQRRTKAISTAASQRIILQELERRIDAQKTTIAATRAAIRDAQREELAKEAEAVQAKIADDLQTLADDLDAYANLEGEIRKLGWNLSGGAHFTDLRNRARSQLQDFEARRRKTYPYGPN